MYSKPKRGGRLGSYLTIWQLENGHLQSASVRSLRLLALLCFTLTCSADLIGGMLVSSSYQVEDPCCLLLSSMVIQGQAEVKTIPYSPALKTFPTLCHNQRVIVRKCSSLFIVFMQVNGHLG